MINGSADVELFVIHDPANRTTISVREASDEQLEKARASAQEAEAQLAQQYHNACMAHAVFTYELDRRKRSIQIARFIT